MTMDLARAPIGKTLVISRFADEEIAARMARMGLYEGARCKRLNPAVSIGPAKVRSGAGDVVLSGWLAGQVIIHLDDDRRLPLLECSPREGGHVEGITGRDAVESSLAELGIREGDRITFLRRLPPMTYHFALNGRPGFRINEALAAHLLGDTETGPAQFSSVGVGEEFIVRRVLPGEDAVSTLASMEVTPGARLALNSVSASHELGLTEETPVACETRDGLRLYFREEEAARILVD